MTFVFLTVLSSACHHLFNFPLKQVLGCSPCTSVARRVSYNRGCMDVLVTDSDRPECSTVQSGAQKTVACDTEKDILDLCPNGFDER